MTIGERVKFRRQQLGLTQQELANRLGNSSRASICTIEKDREDLTTTRIAKLAEALETTAAWIVGWVNDPDPDYPISREKLRAAQEGIDKLVGFKTEHYYEDEETSAVAQSLFENEEMRLLFDAAKDSKPEDLRMVADMLNRLKQTNPGG